MPNFQLAEQINQPKMNENTIHYLTKLFNKAFEYGSIGDEMTKAGRLVDTIVQSVYFESHLFQAISRRKLFTLQLDLPLIEGAIKLCMRFLSVQPSCRNRLQRMKAHISSLMHKQTFPSKLTDLFNEFLRAEKQDTPKKK